MRERLIDISLIFVPSAIDLIEVAQREPFDPGRWLLGEQFRKECVFARRFSWAIHRSDLEHIPSCTYENHGRETVDGADHVGNLDRIVVP